VGRTEIRRVFAAQQPPPGPSYSVRPCLTIPHQLGKGIAHPPYLFAGQQDPVSRLAWGTAILTGLPGPRNSLPHGELCASTGCRVEALAPCPVPCAHDSFHRALIMRLAWAGTSGDLEHGCSVSRPDRLSPSPLL
jgi:hypothetical protein